MINEAVKELSARLCRGMAACLEHKGTFLYIFIYLFIFNFAASLSVQSVQCADIRGHAAACTKDERGGGRVREAVGWGRRCKMLGREVKEEAGAERVGCSHRDQRATGRSVGSSGQRGGVVDGQSAAESLTVFGEVRGWGGGVTLFVL